jgi:hypothetical protein
MLDEALEHASIDRSRAGGKRRLRSKPNQVEMDVVPPQARRARRARRATSRS